MGIDRFVDIEFREVVHASDVLLPLEHCLKQFGMILSRDFKDGERPSPPGEWRLSRFSETTPFSEWIRTHHASANDLVAKIAAPTNTDQWHASSYLHDSKLRYFGIVGISGRTPDEVTDIRFDMRRVSVLFHPRNMTPYPEYFPPEERAAHLQRIADSEALYQELERQEYHFMRTLFEMLPGVAQLDLFYNCEGFEDTPDYCFTRKETQPNARFRERRWPELDQWCDAHEPEYWQQFAPPE